MVACLQQEVPHSMSGNAGMGRPKGSRNKWTEELLALAADGETPVEFGLRIMRDEKATLEQRLQAARFSAPFLHPRPPPAEGAAFELPETDTVEGIARAAAAVLRAVADGRISATDGRHLVDVLDFQRLSLDRLVAERMYPRVALYPVEKKPDVMR
jgi:hypothetical protein